MRAAASSDAAVKASGAQPVKNSGEMTEFPSSAGVYAVYSADQRLQYIGLSRKVSTYLKLVYLI